MMRLPRKIIQMRLNSESWCTNGLVEQEEHVREESERCAGDLAEGGITQVRKGNNFRQYGEFHPVK